MIQRFRFTAALEGAQAAGVVPLISEVKCTSPKEGDLLRGRDPVALARTMVEHGASCISVVTEPTHWGGSMDLLQRVAAGVDVPVIRKDFLRSRQDVYDTRDVGAACFLLIVATMDWPMLRDLYECAQEEGLDTLVEVHDEAEMELAATLPGLRLLGVNNRCIRDFEKDSGTVDRTVSLLGRTPPGVHVVSESAVASPDDVRRVIRAGAFAVLVGTYVLQAGDAGAAVASLVRAGR